MHFWLPVLNSEIQKTGIIISEIIGFFYLLLWRPKKSNKVSINLLIMSLCLTGPKILFQTKFYGHVIRTFLQQL